MTELKPISEITKELYEVLADKTLSFGCRVRNNDGIDGEKIFLGRVDDDLEIKLNKNIEQYSVYQEKMRPCCFRGETMGSHNYTIIGHEPTLSRVLMKLNEIEFEQGELYELQTDGCLIKTTLSKKEIVLEYDLTKSFDNQSEEFKRDLYKLICTK